MTLEQQLSLGDGGKAPRLPRWTRQEILVLIQGKRHAENRFRRGRTAGLPFGSGQVEPKWASVSSYCRKHGVNRGPVQCRKRWSNLAGDYKKIKEWDSQIRDETESFWVMRNDLRRDRKLPGFFDKEVYDILHSPHTPPSALPRDDALCSDFEQGQVVAAAAAADQPIPISDKHQYQPLRRGCQGEGATNENQLPTSNPGMGSTSQGEHKRKRLAGDGDGDEETLQYQLLDVLDRNGKMLSAQLEAQNINFQLERERRKDYTSNLVAVLDKLADAVGRIADKL